MGMIDITEIKRFDIDFKGQLIIESLTRQDAVELLRQGLESIDICGDLECDISDVDKNPTFFVFDIDSFKFILFGKSYEEIDKKILKMIKAICIEYHYDPVIIETVYKMTKNN